MQTPILTTIAPYATPANLITAFIAINFIAFALFGIDKMLAEAARWRIAEATLLFWAMIGGTPGAYAGRHLFRHKTRKQPFSGQVHTVASLQAMLLAGGGAWLMWG